MKRTQIYLEEDIDARLREVACREGRSAAAVVREAVRTYVGRHDSDYDPLRKLIGIYDGSPNAATTIDDVVYELERPIGK